MSRNNKAADQRKVAQAILEEATMLLNIYFKTSINISSAIFLSEPTRRNMLLRLVLAPHTSDIPDSVILKQHKAQKNQAGDQEASSRFSRDWSAHLFLGELLPHTPLVPKFYGGSIKHRFVLLEDLGHEHISLVDPLTGLDPQAARTALKNYTQQMAQLHGLAFQNLNKYNLISQKLGFSYMPETNYYNDAIRNIVPVLHNLGIILNSDIKQEIKHVLKIIKQPSAFTTLIHGDLCPDNVFYDAEKDKLRIIDFEWSSLSNALLDGVYIRMNMPTCWCAKAFPKDLVDELEFIYRHELAKNIPAANDHALYTESYTAACAYWMLWNITVINELWDKDNDISEPQFSNLHPNWPPEYQLRRPRVLSRIIAFIEIAQKHNTLPHLHEMAMLVLNQLQRIWPHASPMGFYRAFL